MADEVGKLYILFDADGRPYIKGLRDVERESEKSGKRIQGSWDKYGRAAGMAVAAGLALGTVAAVSAGKAIVGAAASFEYEFSRIKANANASAAELDALRVLTLKLGKDTAFSANEAAQGANELVKSGMEIADVMKALPGMLALAAAGELDVAQAAEITANQLNTFKLSAKDASVVADTLASAANKSSADVTDLGLSLSMSASVAATAGLTIQETAAALALLANNGLKGSDAGTSLKSMFMQLAAPSQKARDLMQEIGLAVYDNNGDMLEFADIIGEVTAATKGMTQEQKDYTLATIFGSDSVRTANILIGEGEQAYRDMTTAVSETGEAQRVATAKMDNLKGSWEQFKGSLETLGISLGEKALPAVRTFVDDMTATIDTALETGNWSAFGTQLGELVGEGIELATPYVEAAAKALAVAALQAAWEGVKDLPETLFDWGQDKRIQLRMEAVEIQMANGLSFEQAIGKIMSGGGWTRDGVMSPGDVLKIKLKRLELGFNDVTLSEAEIKQAINNGYPESKIQTLLKDKNERIIRSEQDNIEALIRGGGDGLSKAAVDAFGPAGIAGAKTFADDSQTELDSHVLDTSIFGAVDMTGQGTKAGQTFKAGVQKGLGIGAGLSLGISLSPAGGAEAGLESGKVGGLSAGTGNVWTTIKRMYPGASWLGGYATSGHVPGSDHYTGHAFDVGGSNATMHAVRDALVRNFAAWGIKQIIHDRMSYRGNGWYPYTGSNPHTGHVHVSTYADGGWVLPPAETSRGREVPAVLHAGEYVLTQNQAAAMFGGAPSFADGGWVAPEGSYGSYISRESSRYSMYRAEAGDSIDAEELARLVGALTAQIGFLDAAVAEAQKTLDAAKAKGTPEQINDAAEALFGLREQAAEARNDLADLSKEAQALARVPFEQAIEGWNAELDLTGTLIDILADSGADLSVLYQAQVRYLGSIRDANLQMMNAATDPADIQRYGLASARAISDAYEIETARLEEALQRQIDSIDAAQTEWEAGWQARYDAVQAAGEAQREALQEQLAAIREAHQAELSALQQYYSDRLGAMEDAAEAEDRFATRRKLQSEMQGLYSAAGKSAADVDRIISLQGQYRDQERQWTRQDAKSALEDERDAALKALESQQKAEETALEAQAEYQEKALQAQLDALSEEKKAQDQYYDDQRAAAQKAHDDQLAALATAYAQMVTIIYTAMQEFGDVTAEQLSAAVAAIRAAGAPSAGTGSGFGSAGGTGGSGAGSGTGGTGSGQGYTGLGLAPKVTSIITSGEWEDSSGNTWPMISGGTMTDSEGASHALPGGSSYFQNWGRRGPKWVAASEKGGIGAYDSQAEMEQFLRLYRRWPTGVLLAGSTYLYDQGGWLPPGISTVANLTGKPEYVLSPQQLSGMNIGSEIKVSVQVQGDGTTLSDSQVREMERGLTESVIKEIGRRQYNARYAS